MWFGLVKKGAVLDLAFAPDGKTLFTLDGGGQVAGWNLATRERTKLFEVDAAAFSEECPPRLVPSPDGRYLLATDEEKIAVWDLPTGKLGKPVDCHDGSITYPCFVDGGRGLYTIAMAAHWLIHWSWPDLEQLATPEGLDELTEFPFAAAADPAGVRLAVFTSGDRVVVWDVARGQLLTTVEVPAGEYDEVLMAFPPGGETFVVGHHKTLLVCAPERKTVTHALTLEVGVLSRVAFHPAGRLFATAGSAPVVTFWDARVGRSVATWELPSKRLHALAFSPDGYTCAAGGSGRKFAVWDVDDS